MQSHEKIDYQIARLILENIFICKLKSSSFKQPKDLRGKFFPCLSESQLRNFINHIRKHCPFGPFEKIQKGQYSLETRRNIATARGLAKYRACFFGRPGLIGASTNCRPRTVAMYTNKSETRLRFKKFNIV